MLVLGLNFGAHDPTAALVDDGVILMVAEEERYSRVKHAPRQPPRLAVEACLRRCGVAPRDVDAVAIGWDWGRWEPPIVGDQRRDIRSVLDAGNWPCLPPIHHVPHHLSHAACAFWTSGFEDAAILVVDGQGERESISLGSGGPDGVSLHWSAPISSSLGHFYRAAAQFTGLERSRSDRAEGKLMGLAAYGRPSEPMPLLFEDGNFAWVGDLELELAEEAPLGSADWRGALRSALRQWWARRAFPFVDGGASEGIFAYAPFAASVQAALERAELQLVARLRDEVASQNLVITGGVALNCSGNGAIVDAALYDRVHVNPVPHDVGVAAGAALHVSWLAARDGRGKFAPLRMETAQLGDEPHAHEMRNALDRAGLAYDQEPDGSLHRAAAAAIAAGSLVAWFRGRAEIGPRALGARSLLADPRKRDTVGLLNAAKGREPWRPLAPSVLAEHFIDYFDSPFASPFMNVRAFVRPEVRQLIPAVVHVDGSARPQAVDRRLLPDYWTLIDEFARMTGVPVILNTSLNLAGEPIVSSPDDAIRTFVASAIDVLVLGNFIVRRRA